MNCAPEESTTTAPASPPSLPCDAANRVGVLTTDFIALVGFAARLGACVNNDDTADDGQDAKSVRDEAMLLMSLLMGDKAEEILSDVKESRCEKRRCRGRIGRAEDSCNVRNFSFTFPSLSLQRDRHPEATASGPATEAAGRRPRDGRDEAEDRPCPSPSQLLARVQSVHDKDLIRDGGEAMAHNVLESFGAALVWRAKTWIKSLANVLALKEQKRIDARRAASGVEVEADRDEDDDTDEGGGGDENDDDLMNSKEMQIIDSIVKSSEEVSVVNIKTSFCVLPNRVSHLNGDAPPSTTDTQEPSPKKARKEQSPRDVGEYELTHKLMFEATISMTSNDGVRYNGVKLQAPGYIQGTFANNAGSSTEGGETLTGVSITLDTDALALSLERQSRLVVRRAAEVALVSSRCADYGPSHGDCAESPQRAQHRSAISPRYVLMSPVPECSGGSSEWLPPIPRGDALNGEDPMELNEEAESEKVPVVSDEDTSPNTTPSFTPTGQVDLTKRHSPSMPALLSVANEERIRGG
jgi:hypothetical protein